jgi:hypothetical protein
MSRKDYDTCDSGCGETDAPWKNSNEYYVPKIWVPPGRAELMLASQEGLPMRGVGYVILVVR